MFKVIAAEIKKIVSKPGIYILSVLLAIILILGTFIYLPKEYDNYQFELKGDTFIQKYDTFNAGTNAGKKAESQSNLNASIKMLDVYSSPSKSPEYLIKTKLESFNEQLASYRNCINDASSQNYINTVRNKLVNSISDLNTTIENALLTSQRGSYSILTSKSNYINFKTYSENLINWANIFVSKNNLKEHINQLDSSILNEYLDCLQNFKFPKLDPDIVNSYISTDSETKYSTLLLRLNEIDYKINAHYTQCINSADANLSLATEMDKLANEYVNTITTFTTLIKYEIITNAFTYVSTSEQLNTMYLSDYSNFNAKSLLVRSSFLFEHNKSENDFARPLTIGVSSNNNVNAYDYAYFVSKIFSFVIIIYAIMASCYTIAGEIKEGSMRYFAIRPVSRPKIFLGKWFSILIMSAILIIFSGIISLCVGFAVYGATTKPILAIFNGTTPLVLKPIAMIGIYLASMFLELMVYSTIAILFSTLFKSDLMSVTILLVMYLLNSIIPIFVQGANSWLAFYPFSHISFYSLFGSSVYAVSNNFFNLMFGAKTYSISSLALTSSVIVITTLVILFISIKLFKKKEL